MAGPVVILTGPPGAGKSTVADVLARQSEMPAVHLHSDDFYDRYIKSGYVLPWLPESQKQNEVVTGVIAGAACAYAAGERRARGSAMRSFATLRTTEVEAKEKSAL